MRKYHLQTLANELAKNLKTPDDLSQFDRLLKKISIEAALNAEMSHHLGYDKNQSKPAANSRNGYSTKTVTTGDSLTYVLRTPKFWGNGNFGGFGVQPHEQLLQPPGFFQLEATTTLTWGYLTINHYH